MQKSTSAPGNIVHQEYSPTINQISGQRDRRHMSQRAANWLHFSLPRGCPKSKESKLQILKTWPGNFSGCICTRLELGDGTLS